MWHWSLEQKGVDVVLADSAHCELSHVSDQSCVFLQHGVREAELKLNEMEQALAGKTRLEKVVLGMLLYVSLRWCYT